MSSKFKKFKIFHNNLVFETNRIIGKAAVMINAKFLHDVVHFQVYEAHKFW